MLGLVSLKLAGISRGQTVSTSRRFGTRRVGTVGGPLLSVVHSFVRSFTGRQPLGPRKEKPTA